MLRFVSLVMLLAAAPWPSIAQEPEHLPLRARPPSDGELPAGLAPYAVRVASPARSEADRRFDLLVDDYLRATLALNPIQASELGFVQYDARMPATDSLGIVSATVEFGRLRAALDSIVVRELDPTRRRDLGVLSAALATERTIDPRVRMRWRKDPTFYTDVASRGLHAVMERTYPPLEERTWNMIARLTAIPRVFLDARTNLLRPPREATGVAIRECAAFETYLADSLPIAMAPVRDAVAREEFDHHLASATGAAAEYRHWLQDTLLPRSSGGPTSSHAVGSESRVLLARLLEDRRPDRR